MTRTSSKPILNVLAGERMDPPPIWMMRQAGRHLPEYRVLREKAGGFLDMCYTPDFVVEATLQPVRRYGMDAAILFSDILVVPDALGIPVRFETGIGPKLKPLEPGKNIPRLDEDAFDRHLAPVFQAIGDLRRELSPATALIGFAGAPWTLATYLVEGGGSKDYHRTRLWARNDPASFKQLIDRLVDAVSHLLIRQIDAGVEAVQIFDSWAGILPAGEFERWVTLPIAEIVRRVRRHHADLPVIGFPRGAGLRYAAFMAETGVDAVSIDCEIPLAWARDELQSRAAVQGNLDNMLLLAGGPDLDAEVAAILKALAGGPHIFNLAHGVLPDTPIAHVEAVIERVRSA